MKVRFSRLVVLPAASTGLVLLGCGVASAHVTVSAPEAAPGGFAEITFNVPTESDTASTVKLQVQLPKDTPLASVSTKPVPGWTATTTTSQLAQPVKTDDGDTVTDVVSQITWTADNGQGTAPGQYQTFSISAGPLPKSGQLVFPAIQTYSDGSTVSWIDPTIEGQPEPQHPAPMLKVAASDAAASPSSAASSSPTSTGQGASGVAVTGLVLAIIALLAALAAVALAMVNRRRSAPQAGQSTGAPKVPAA